MKRISIILSIIILIPITTSAEKSADPILVYDVTLNGLVKVVDRKLLFILMPDKSVYRINYEEDNDSTENAELEKLESEWEIFRKNVTIYNMNNTRYYIWHNGKSRDDLPIWQRTWQACWHCSWEGSAFTIFTWVMRGEAFSTCFSSGPLSRQ